MTDHYSELGVPKGASKAEIRRAYRKRAQNAHPDREGGDADAMSRINAAYACLSDDSKLARYDQTGCDDTHVQTLEEKAIGRLSLMVASYSNQMPEDGDLVCVMKAQLQIGSAQAQSDRR